MWQDSFFYKHFSLIVWTSITEIIGYRFNFSSEEVAKFVVHVVPSVIMRIFQPTSINSAAKLLYNCCRLTGLLPFSYIINNSSFLLQISIPSLAWSILLCIFYIHVYYDLVISNLVFYERNSVNDFVQIVTNFIVMFGFSTPLITFWSNKNNMKQLMTSLIEIDLSLKLKSSHEVLFVAVELSAYFVLNSVCSVFFWLQNGVDASFLIIIPIIFTINLSELIFINFVRLLQLYFKHLNARIEGRINNDRSRRTYKLESLRELSYAQVGLCDAARKLNGIFSWLLLCVTAMDFITSLNLVYNLTSEYIGFATMEGSLVMWLSIPYLLFKHITRIYSCNKLYAEVQYLYCLISLWNLYSGKFFFFFTRSFPKLWVDYYKDISSHLYSPTSCFLLFLPIFPFSFQCLIWTSGSGYSYWLFSLHFYV